MEEKFINKILTFVLIGILLVIAFIVLRSILIAIVVGLLLAYIFQPVYKKIHSKVSNKNLSTAILMILIILTIAIPLWFLIPIIAKQTFEAYMYLQRLDLTTPLQKILPSLFTPEFTESFASHIYNFINQLFNKLLTSFGNFLMNIPNLLLQIAVILFTFYFAVRDSDKLEEYVSSLSPLSSSTEKKFAQEFRNITNTVIYGQFLIALIQGLALGMGLLILGVPKTLLLTVIAIIASFVPIIGPWIVWLPISITLILSGEPLSGIILFVYGALFVSSIDNLLRPMIISKKTNLPTSIALIGIIGGIYAFGIIGLILGPLILAYVLIIIDFYRQGKLGELFKS